MTRGTTLTRMMWNALTLRQHLWNERDLSKKFATIRDRSTSEENLSQTVRADTWGTATAGIVKTGPAVAIDIRTPIDRQAQWLIEEEPDYFLTYPSNAVALAQHFLDNHLQLQNLCQVRTFGETVDPRLRDLCRIFAARRGRFRWLITTVLRKLATSHCSALNRKSITYSRKACLSK